MAVKWREPSTELLATLRDLEAFRAKAYPDSGGVWTIGYGATRFEDGTPVKRGDTITRSGANGLLAQQAGHYVYGVHQLVTAVLTPGQWDAVTCLVYNIGLAAFADSTGVRPALNRDPRSPTVDAEWKRWVHVKGVVVAGLVLRRRRELRWFRS